MVTGKPPTEDYVPVLPWLGVMLWGVGAAQWLLRRRASSAGAGASSAQHPLGPAGRGLALLGRWSLSYYMLHQPVMIGLLMGFGALRRVMG